MELSLPRWLYEMWSREYGEERTAAMARSFLKEGVTTIRVKPEKKQEAIESLKKQGAAVEEDCLVPGIFYLKDYDYLEGLEAFQKGWLQVQDLSSALVGALVPPMEDSLVLDVCAAPGGKSLHMAELLKGSGRVEARDISDRKTGLIEENARRGGFENVVCRTWDARVLDESMVEKADLVLADLPCSGLGILRRKPDIKWKMSPEQMKELEILQREILSIVWRYVKPGGRLVYSTCTVNPGENQENAKWFADSFPFEPMDLRGKLGPEFEEESLKKGWIQLMPGIHPGDGFFISAFRRRPEPLRKA